MVVHDDVFHLDAILKADCADALKDGVNEIFLIMDGDYDREFYAVGHEILSCFESAGAGHD